MKNENFDLTNFKAAYDWRSAFHEAFYHSDGGSYEGEHIIDNVTRIVCCEEGENDGASWPAIVEWSGTEGKYAIVDAGCDYTGWDCMASGAIEFHDELSAALHDLTPEQAERLGVPHDANTARKDGGN